MTSRQVAVLRKCCVTDPINPGMAQLFAQQAGLNRQVKWLLGRKLIRKLHGRLVITNDGRKILDYQTS